MWGGCIYTGPFGAVANKVHTTRCGSGIFTGTVLGFPGNVLVASRPHSWLKFPVPCVLGWKSNRVSLAVLLKIGLFKRNATHSQQAEFASYRTASY